jgi:hypothetical protein
MAYEYTNRQTDAWSWESQCALWRERALHSAERAAFFKRLAETLQNGNTITPSGKDPMKTTQKDN